MSQQRSRRQTAARPSPRGTALRWPDQAAYNAAVRDVKNLSEKSLRGLAVEMRAMGVVTAPFARAGRFGVVYKFQGKDSAYALKLFSNDIADRGLRYQLISEHFQHHGAPPALVSFSYNKTGIVVNGARFPTLVMDWFTGETLDAFLQERFRRSSSVDNEQLSSTWVATVRALQDRGIGHGDLQHGNILVDRNGVFRLVDYDGMFVPAMAEKALTACEAGLPAYQHRQRSARPEYFNADMDDFSALVILLTLKAANRDLWARFHRDDDHLLIKPADLRQPDESALLTELRNNGGEVGRLAKLVVEAARSDLAEVPPFEDAVAGAPVTPTAARLEPALPMAGPTGPRLPPGVLPDLRPRPPRREDGPPPTAAVPATRAKRTPNRAPSTGPRAAVAKVPRTPGSRSTGAGGGDSTKARRPKPALKPTDLTERRRAVVALLAKGRTVSEIATVLRVQPGTVRGHLCKAREALGVATNEEVAAWYRSMAPAPGPGGAVGARTKPKSKTRPSPPKQPTPKGASADATGAGPRVDARSGRPGSAPARRRPPVPGGQSRPPRPTTPGPSPPVRLPDLGNLPEKAPQTDNLWLIIALVALLVFVVAVL